MGNGEGELPPVYAPECDSISRAMDIIKFINTADALYLSRINVVVADISRARELNMLVLWLLEWKERVCFHLPVQLVKDTDFHLKLQEFGFQVVVTCDPSHYRYRLLKKLLTESDNPFKIDFIVRSAKDYYACKRIIDKLGIRDTCITPGYKNRCGQLFSFVNTTGNLVITTDGVVYSNLNNPPLGVIKDTPYEIMIRKNREKPDSDNKSKNLRPVNRLSGY